MASWTGATQCYLEFFSLGAYEPQNLFCAGRLTTGKLPVNKGQALYYIVYSMSPLQISQCSFNYKTNKIVSEVLNQSPPL